MDERPLLADKPYDSYVNSRQSPDDTNKTDVSDDLPREIHGQWFFLFGLILVILGTLLMIAINVINWVPGWNKIWNKSSESIVGIIGTCIFGLYVPIMMIAAAIIDNENPNTGSHWLLIVLAIVLAGIFGFLQSFNNKLLYLGLGIAWIVLVLQKLYFKEKNIYL